MSRGAYKARNEKKNARSGVCRFIEEHHHIGTFCKVGLSKGLLVVSFSKVFGPSERRGALAKGTHAAEGSLQSEMECATTFMRSGSGTLVELRMASRLLCLD